MKKLINKIIELTFKSMTEHLYLKDTLSLNAFVSEFATSTLYLPRQLGKTNGLTEYCNDSSKRILILVKTENDRNQLKITNTNVTILINSDDINGHYNNDIIFNFGREITIFNYTTIIININ